MHSSLSMDMEIRVQHVGRALCYERSYEQHPHPVFIHNLKKITPKMLSKLITASASPIASASAYASIPAPVPASTSVPVPVHASRRSRRSCRSRCGKNRTTDYFLATNRRKAFDRSFAAGMDAAIAYLMEMEAAAARVELPMKRARKDTAFAPRKKKRISSIKETSLTAESSESKPLGSYWTTAPDRRGDMILVRRSHYLTRS